MMSLMLAPRPGERLRVLCLGAHSDDIEIGCGATILGLCAADVALEVTWVVFSAGGERGQEARRSAKLFLAGAGAWQLEAHEFRDGFFPYEGVAIKERFEELKSRPSPDLILTHRGKDRHQDHRTISELTWNTFRDHLILEYEIPKYDADLGRPNVFVPATAEVRQRKIELLMEVFATQRSKRWFTPETFEALMRLRGIECASPTGYAEAFHARKIILGAT
jgi:LmbE family N-acetylglucosaminyl deacetylase